MHFGQTPPGDGRQFGHSNLNYFFFNAIWLLMGYFGPRPQVVNEKKLEIDRA